jgi:hypothetical protein
MRYGNFFFFFYLNLSILVFYLASLYKIASLLALKKLENVNKTH